MENEFLLRKMIEFEPSTIDLIPQNNEQKYKKRKNSSSDASSVIKPLGKKMKNQQSVLKKQFPMVVDGITVCNLGRIIYDRPAYFSESCIYPVGYKISRVYNNTSYVLRIIDNGSGPRFDAFPATDPSRLFSGATAVECLSQLVSANLFSQSYPLDGLEMFGLSNKKIKDLIYSLPNARRLTKIKHEIKQENLLTSYD